MTPAEPTPTQPNTAAEPAGTEATSTGPTADLPELVVDGQDKKKKEAAKSNEKATSRADHGRGNNTEPHRLPVSLWARPRRATRAPRPSTPSNVKMRTDGGGDANTFMRNLPNVQYQQATPQSRRERRQDG